MADLTLLAEPADVTAQLAPRTQVDPERVTTLLRMVSAEFRAQTRQHITLVADDEVFLDGNGSRTLLLPQLPVVGVSSVLVDGEELDGGYDWNEDGILRRRAGWPKGLRNVQVTYSHGHEQAPEDVKLAVAEAVAIRLGRRPGMVQGSHGGVSATWMTGTTASWTAAVQRHALRRGKA